MATSKEDIKYGAAQAKVTDDDMLRTGYINGTPLEAGKIAESEPVDLFSDARRVAEATANKASSQQQRQREEEEAGKTAQSEHAAPLSDARRVGEA